MALTTIAEGTSTVTETVFENRFMHVAELVKWGRILTSTIVKLLSKVYRLHGAIVNATDLRAGRRLYVLH